MSAEVAAPAHTELITGEELARMADMGRSELIEGRLVMLSPTQLHHGKTEMLIGEALQKIVTEEHLGVVATGEVGIYTHRNPDTVRGADVLFISHARLAQLGEAAFLDVAPELVVEVLSPEDRWSEVRQKIREYFAVGVLLVWVADPEERSVHIYRSPTDVRVLTGEDVLSGEEVLSGFSVLVALLFE